MEVTLGGGTAPAGVGLIPSSSRTSSSLDPPLSPLRIPTLPGGTPYILASAPRRGVQRPGGERPHGAAWRDAASTGRGAAEGVCRSPPSPPRAGSVWGRGCGWGRCGAAGLAGPAAGPARPGPSAAPRPAGASAHIGCAGMGPSRPEQRLCHLSNTLHPTSSAPPALPLPFFPPLPISFFFFFYSPFVLPLFSALASSTPAFIATQPPAPGKCGARGSRGTTARAHSLLSLNTLLHYSLPPPYFFPSFSFCVSWSSC